MALNNNKLFKIANDSRNINSQCKVVVYRWKHQNADSDLTEAQLSDTTKLDISSQIINCTYQKNMSEVSGAFSITLSNSPGLKESTGDWKDIIKRGEWCVIYMSQDGDLLMNSSVGPPNAKANIREEAKKIRCVGFIDRISPNTTVDEKGAFDVTYTIEGRDFGVVYEDTEIWHNLFQFDKILLDSLASQKLNVQGNTKIDEILTILHDLFFDPIQVPGAKLRKDTNSLTSISQQWLLPRQLIQDVFRNFSPGKTSFWGSAMKKRFSTTEAGLSVVSPIDYLTGNAWAQLKAVSVPEFHELFTETDDAGIPGLTFRPIPFSFNQENYQTVGKHITLFKDISPVVNVPAIDVLETNLAEDNHARYNSFLATVSSELFGIHNNISLLKGSGFPKFNQGSIKRYGFRPMHVNVDTIIKNAQKSGGKGHEKILKEFNHLLHDYWNNYVFTSSGTLEQIGNNKIKIGKALVFNDDVPYEARKRYYIEGYNDTFAVEENGATYWSQQVMLTRGLEEDDLQKISEKGFTNRDTAFTQEGEYTPSGGSQT